MSRQSAARISSTGQGDPARARGARKQVKRGASPARGDKGVEADNGQVKFRSCERDEGVDEAIIVAEAGPRQHLYSPFLVFPLLQQRL